MFHVKHWKEKYSSGGVCDFRENYDFYFKWLLNKVMSCIIIYDSIWKIDTINRLRRGGMSLLRAIMMAGHNRLKPIIMTSLTTMLAILPFLHRGDMGSALQYPLSLTIIVGMGIGTMVSLFMVPLFYYLIYKNRKA